MGYLGIVAFGRIPDGFILWPQVQREPNHGAEQKLLPVAGLFIQNPPPLRQLIVGAHGWWNLWLLAVPVSWQIPDELDSIANARRIHAPAVFLLSDNDEVVGYRFQRMVLEAYACDKTVIVHSGAGHNDAINPETASRINEAVRQMLPSTK